jgi:uncharacterized protein (TIGR00730 family)
VTEVPPPSVSPFTDDLLQRRIDDLIASVGGEPKSFAARLVGDLIRTSLKLFPDGADHGQMKLLAASLKEMRHAYRVFGRYRGRRKISIFGSARTPPDHPDYAAAKAFSQQMAGHGWMAITGAGDGIMKAGHEGPQREASFGLSIRLPFETTANTVIEGDPKLINFRYFFTRKLMFLSHSDAIAVFPGGFGTQDELFESLTLVQTGKSNIVPIVMVEGAGGDYWPSWEESIQRNLLRHGWISPEDPALYYIAPDVESAVEHVMRFYRRYHSSRYVGDQLVIRMLEPLTPEQVEGLNAEFAPIVKSGRIQQVLRAIEGEEDHLELPRLVFSFIRRKPGVLRRLLDRLNELP